MVVNANANQQFRIVFYADGSLIQCRATSAAPAAERMVEFQNCHRWGRDASRLDAPNVINRWRFKATIAKAGKCDQSRGSTRVEEIVQS